MGMQKNWSQFIEETNAKSKSHLKAASYWNCVSSCLKLVSALSYQIFIFHQMAALQKL